MNGPTQPKLRSRFLRTALRGLTPAVLAVIMAGSAAAQYDEEPPALVGRISAIHGSASIQRSDAQDWVDAGINEPVTVGDAVYAPQDADVRLQIGQGTGELVVQIGCSNAEGCALPVQQVVIADLAIGHA